MTTCQGLYFEICEKEVDWKHWKEKRLPIGGDLCWREGGVTIYKPTRQKINRTIVPHRFAINPRTETPRTELRIDRYYIHVYQTKIGPDRRTLRSKSIARELQRRFKGIYWPRKIDIQSENLEINKIRKRTNTSRPQILRSTQWLRGNSGVGRGKKYQQEKATHGGEGNEQEGIEDQDI